MCNFLSIFHICSLRNSHICLANYYIYSEFQKKAGKELGKGIDGRLNVVEFTPLEILLALPLLSYMALS
jgi:hypothetical protein